MLGPCTPPPAGRVQVSRIHTRRSASPVLRGFAPEPGRVVVRRDPDPIRRGRRATSLLSFYQQRATELARLRREAIEEAHRAQGLTYTEIAAALGITKGRVTQIRTGAPARERAFFGVGPVQVGVPLREGTDDRMRSYVDAADLATQADMETLLGYWIAEADPRAAHHAIVISIPPHAATWAVLATDGAADSMAYAGQNDWAEVAQYEDAQLSGRLLRLHRWEEYYDPEGRRLPRAKRHDDKTIAAVPAIR